MSTKLNNALHKAAGNGHLDEVKRLLETGAAPVANDYLALRLAAGNGHLEIVKLLLPASDPKADDSLALQWAAMNGHLEVVKLLLPVSDPRANNSSALRWSAMNGHLEVAKLLLPVSDPRANNSSALRRAVESGHLEIVKLLLPFSNYAHMLKDPDFIQSPGCDLLLSCLPGSFIKQFMVDNPTLSLPRTTAMLAAQALSHKRAPTKRVTLRRARA